MQEKDKENHIADYKLIRIPIAEFEKDMNTKSAKEKKDEIYNLLTNSNNHLSIKEYNEIKKNIHEACKEGDVELIKIYLSETIENESHNLIFKIDRANQTASLFKVNNKIDELIIPRTVKHESTEYLITSIVSTGFFIKTIKFVEDSAVETIFAYSFKSFFGFSAPLIKEIYFPASLTELKEGWCNNTDKLTKITVSPFNKNFIMKENKYLLGKSDENKDEFDILLFACRDIEEISIPSNIKIISSYAFENCTKLTKVQIPINSNLQIIESVAFKDSNINEIFIPSTVSKIGQYAFFLCNNLTKIEIPTNSKLQTIESNAFSNIKIDEIYFPADLSNLKKGWCGDINKLRKITVSPFNKNFIMKENKYLLGKCDENKDEFDILLFACRDIEEISVPSNIKIISSYVFENCTKLTKVQIPINSNLQAIESYAFSKTIIKEIFIPSTVSKIGNNAFNKCKKLKKVDFQKNSNLQIIGSFAFTDSKIKEIFIPPNVSKISKGAFADCYYLTKIEIPTNSNLQIIESFAFANVKIKEIFIPSSVTKICEMAFLCCENLQIVEIAERSKLESLPLSIFDECTSFKIMIPSSLKKLI